MVLMDGVRGEVGNISNPGFVCSCPVLINAEMPEL